MKRYPLHTLLKLREHRTEAARMVVLERQRAVRVCRDACTVVEGEIIALQFERGQQRLRLLDAPPSGVPWANALAQREAHIELLAIQVQAAQQRLAQAQQKLREAEQALDAARTAYLRAKARQEALEKRRDLWGSEQRALDVRQEELASADLMLARRIHTERQERSTT